MKFLISFLAIASIPSDPLELLEIKGLYEVWGKGTDL